MDEITQIKERLDIVEIMSTYLTLKKAGKNYKANCPFHSEKTPSLMISQERQTFKCFGCGEGGDIFTFVEKMEGLDFYNALKLLAGKAGVELKSDSIKFGDKEHRSDKKTKTFEINEWAKKVYHKILLDHPKGENAREYLQKRGLTKETIENFEIGYAPKAWDFILKFLKSKNYTEQEIVEAGVAIKNDTGRIYDRFRGRVVFPINNIMGNTIAFTCRILEDEHGAAKYINSSESPIYTKGKTIYGLDKAKVTIKSENLAVMVEGNMDVITCHQSGFQNVVATSGTALTLDQLKVLSRYAPEIAFSFDSDNAGQTAMKRAIRMALENDISIKIIKMPAPFKDPDEAIKADPENWKKAVRVARPALEYWIDSMVGDKKLGVSDKKTIAKEILPVIKVIFSDIEKEHYLKYLSEKLSVSEQSLTNALYKSKADAEFKKSPEELKPTPKKLPPAERILSLLWAEQSLLELVPENFSIENLADNNFNPLYQQVLKREIVREKIKPELASIYDQTAIIALENIETENDEALAEEVNYLMGRLRSENIEKVKEEFARKIKEAENKGDKEALKKLLLEFSNLIK